LFILVYLKTYALQVVHGRLFGMVQGKANQCTLSAAMGYTTQNLTSPAGRRRQR